MFFLPPSRAAYFIILFELTKKNACPQKADKTRRNEQLIKIKYKSWHDTAEMRVFLPYGHVGWGYFEYYNYKFRIMGRATESEQFYQ